MYEIVWFQKISIPYIRKFIGKSKVSRSCALKASMDHIKSIPSVDLGTSL